MTELKFFKPKGRISCESEIIQVKTEEIRPNRAQPRANFDQNALIRLTDSIRRYGILQPLTIRRLPMEEAEPYELIAGERRLRAAKLLGLYSVPCVILEVDERVSAEMAIIENLLREDLNMFEQACGFRRLIEFHGLTQEEVARKMSMSQSAVANKLRLLRLGYDEQRMILEGGLSERHARALLKLNDEAARLKMIEYIIANRLTVQATELYIDSLLKQHKSGGPAVEKEAKSFADIHEERTKELLSMVQKRVQAMNLSGIRSSVSIEHFQNGVSVTILIPNDDECFT